MLVVWTPFSWDTGRDRSDGQGMTESWVCLGRLYSAQPCIYQTIQNMYLSLTIESLSQRGPELCLPLCRSGRHVQAQLVQRLLLSEPRRCCGTQPWFPFSSASTQRENKQGKESGLPAPTKTLQAHPLHLAKHCLAYGLCFPLQSHLTLITSAS